MKKSSIIGYSMNRMILSILAVFLTGQTLRGNDFLHKADSLYSRHLYKEAMDRYESLLQDDRFLRNDFDLNFKLAYCYLQNNKVENAENIFQRLRSQTDLIPEYLDYFSCLANLKLARTSGFKTAATRFIRTYPKHFLADSILYYLSDFTYRRGEYAEAQSYYQKLFQKKNYKKSQPLFLYRMAMCDLYLNRKQQAMEKLHQTMLKYPDSDEALQVAEMIDAYKIDKTEYIFTVADVYLDHRQFSDVRERLENFIRSTSDVQLIEKARYYLLRVYYEEGQYKTALYGFKTFLNELKNETLAPRILLMIARCQLRAGQKSEAAETYLQYAEKYPRRRMAVEAIWKSAWIYEELGEIENSLLLYQKLKKHWPYSAYREETEFRIGFSYYRLGQYQSAADEFRYGLRGSSSTFQNHRASYWLAKTLDKQGLSSESLQLYTDLGSQVLNSYYALKAYFEHRTQLDSLLNFKQKLIQTENPLRQYETNISTFVPRFKQLFIIHELLPDSYAHEEVNEKKYRASSVGEWIALAEIYKRLGVYNRAFQIYDYLDNKHFYEMDHLEKPFLLKEAFPLHYDKHITEYARQRDLDRKLILAVIRAESAYDKRAHSWANAYGLMQIIPPTAAEIASELSVPYENPASLFDADLNINMGTYYLKKLLQKFNYKFEYALAAYNAGPHRVQKWLMMLPENDIDVFVENIEFSQTRNYVRKVLRNYWIYSILEELN